METMGRPTIKETVSSSLRKRMPKRTPKTGVKKVKAESLLTEYSWMSLKPDEITDKGNNHRLVEEGDEDGQIHVIDPLGFEQETHDQQDGDGEEKLIEKGIDGMDLFCHKPFDVNRCRPPKNGSKNFKDISQKHR